MAGTKLPGFTNKKAEAQQIPGLESESVYQEPISFHHVMPLVPTYFKIPPTCSAV